MRDSNWSELYGSLSDKLLRIFGIIPLFIKLGVIAGLSLHSEPTNVISTNI